MVPEIEVNGLRSVELCTSHDYPLEELDLRWQQVCKVEAISIHNVCYIDANLLPEYRSIIDEGVEFPILSAGVH